MSNHVPCWCRFGETPLVTAMHGGGKLYAILQSQIQAGPLLKAFSDEERQGRSDTRWWPAWGQELGGTALNRLAKRYARDQVTLSLGLQALKQKIGDDRDFEETSRIW